MYRLPIEKLGKVLKVAVLGVGGTGSAFCLNELVRLDTTLRELDSNSGLDVHVFDGGVVTQANITRQTFFPAQVGSNKSDAVVWTANNLHGKSWVSHPLNVDVTKSNQFSVQQYDIIVTALDRPSVRYQLSQLKPFKSVLWLDMGNDATSGNTLIGELGKEKYLPNICDLYDYSTLSDDDAEIKSCSAQESIDRQQLGVNQTAARLGGQLLWNLLRNGELKYQGAYFDVQTLHVDPIAICESTWAIYGYSPTQSLETATTDE